MWKFRMDMIIKNGTIVNADGIFRADMDGQAEGLRQQDGTCDLPRGLQPEVRGPRFLAAFLHRPCRLYGEHVQLHAELVPDGAHGSSDGRCYRISGAAMRR